MILGGAIPLIVVGMCIGVIYLVTKYEQNKLKKKQNSRSRYHIESTFHISIPLLINMNVFLYFSTHTVPDELATSVYWKLDDAGSP